MQFSDSPEEARWRSEVRGFLENEYPGATDSGTLEGGLFDRGDGYDPAELSPVFVDRDAIVRKVLFDGSDPSNRFVSMEQWRREFAQHNAGELPSTARPPVAEPEREAGLEPGPEPGSGPGMVAVGRVTVRGQRLYESKRRSERQRIESRGLNPERGRGSSEGR